MIFYIPTFLSISIFSIVSSQYFVDFDILKWCVDISSIFQKMAIYRQSILIFHFKKINKSKSCWKIGFLTLLGHLKCPYRYQYLQKYFQEWPNQYWINIMSILNQFNISISIMALSISIFLKSVDISIFDVAYWYSEHP